MVAEIPTQGTKDGIAAKLLRCGIASKKRCGETCHLGGRFGYFFGRNLDWWAKNWQKLKNAQFYSEKRPRKTATKMWPFLLYFWSLLSQFLCLFHLVSPYFLLFRAILEPQNSPPSEVTGIF